MSSLERREITWREAGRLNDLGPLRPVAPLTMRILKECRLVDVLGEWGIHEGEGRLQLPAGTFEGDERLLSGVEVTLTRRSPLAWRILAGWPMASLRIEIAPDDVAALRITDGRTVEDWTNAVLKDQMESGAHVRALADTAEVVSGPLTCTAQTADGSVACVKPPIVIFDGWHRAAAWIAQLRRGATYPMAGSLVVTRHPVALLGQQ